MKGCVSFANRTYFMLSINVLSLERIAQANIFHQFWYF